MTAEAGEAVVASTATSGSQDDGAASLHVTPTPNQRLSIVRRTQCSTPSPSARVSPYPLHERTPPQALSPSAPPVRRQARVSLDASSESGETEEANQHRLQLVVQPIVKDTVGQRDNSGKLLEVFAANGATFSDIKRKLWEKFSSRVKRIAVKQDDTWSDEDPTEAAWGGAMVFKWNTHLVPTAKSEQAWSRWVVSRRGDTVTLLIFEYGTGIPNARALEAFMQSCIRPQHTDRSGAAAEASIREIVTQLQDIWGATYQGTAVVWRMWANAIMRNLDRSTWEAAVLEPPTATVEQLLSWPVGKLSNI
ncbi:hypothetical protein PF008_g11206 [Phytophthora fragariae]|uniref:Uncharacterized protein n=1 Tax=Phytophthora fragariae TaxID=53985 RepID=A0A6G0RS11_9STRA|nr:hypothetical protein PF008_g11206 [Phytophthora fragariae]